MTGELGYAAGYIASTWASRKYTFAITTQYDIEARKNMVKRIAGIKI